QVAVSARSQGAGRGRGGRAWQDPPGEALMVSLGWAGPLPASVLDGLPLRVADAVLAAIELVAPAARDGIRWKAPNDLVAARDGAKVAGILVDARTLDGVVDPIIVGIGVNLAGAAFITTDGRDATTVEQVVGVRVERDDLLPELVRLVGRAVRPPA
ncbi:MAG: hypothetical protein JWM98_2101, partial [Thermoleophilia bacterium]|nr:hypothetical protein [Thermoleophilia bacterium]